MVEHEIQDQVILLGQSSHVRPIALVRVHFLVSQRSKTPVPRGWIDGQEMKTSEHSCRTCKFVSVELHVTTMLQAKGSAMQPIERGCRLKGCTC